MVEEAVKVLETASVAVVVVRVGVVVTEEVKVEEAKKAELVVAWTELEVVVMEHFPVEKELVAWMEEMDEGLHLEGRVEGKDSEEQEEVEKVPVVLEAEGVESAQVQTAVEVDLPVEEVADKAAEAMAEAAMVTTAEAVKAVMEETVVAAMERTVVAEMLELAADMEKAVEVK